MPEPHLSTTNDTDWQLDSVLLFADRVRMSLNPGRSTQTPTEKALCLLVERFMGAVNCYYRDGVNQFEGKPPTSNGALSFTGQGWLDAFAKASYERNQMIAIISEEWNSLMTMIATAHLFDGMQDSTFAALCKLIDEAKGDLNLDKIKENFGLDKGDELEFIVLPHFGRNFELVSFTYAPTIFLLGVPVNKLYVTWDWSVIWHEMAGVYAESERRLRLRERNNGTGGVIYEVAQQLEELLGKPIFRNELCTAHVPELDQIMPQGQLDKELVLSWAKEFVEDAFAVLCLGEGMLTALKPILEAAYATNPTAQPPATHANDTKPVDGEPVAKHADPPEQAINSGTAIVGGTDPHPPHKLRIAVARSLALQVSGAQPMSDPADVIAKLLLDCKVVSLTCHQWSKEEQSELNQVISRAPVSVDTLKALPPRVKLVATANAVYKQQLICEDARSVFCGTNPTRPSFSSTGDFGLPPTPSTTGQWLTHTFSRRDYGMASPVSCTSQGAGWYIARAAIDFSCTTDVHGSCRINGIWSFGHRG